MSDDEVFFGPITNKEIRASRRMYNKMDPEQCRKEGRIPYKRKGKQFCRAKKGKGMKLLKTGRRQAKYTVEQLLAVAHEKGISTTNKRSGGQLKKASLIAKLKRQHAI